MSNTYTKNYSDGSALTESQLDTALQTLQLDAANTPLLTTGSTTGQALISNGSAVAASFQTIPDPLGMFALRNYGLKATVATGVMTITLTSKAGTSPSGSDIVNFNYNTAGTTSATYSSVNVSSTTTFTLNASATLGYSSTAAARIFVYGYYNTAAAAVKLAVSARNDWDFGEKVSTTAVSASADISAIYASAVLSVAPRLLGYIIAAHNSAGAWQTPTNVNLVNHVSASAVDFNRSSTTAAARVGQVGISASCGNFSNSTTSFVAVTNLSVTLTTTGRPVHLSLIDDGSGNQSRILVGKTASATSISSSFSFFRNTSSLTVANIAYSHVGATTTTDIISIPVSSISHLDTPSAGTYTYTFKIKGDTANDTQTQVRYAKLIAYEL